MSMLLPPSPPLQTTSQLCAPLSQSTSVTPVELPVLLSVTARVEHSTAEPGLRARRLADTGSEREEEPVARRRLFIWLPASYERREENPKFVQLLLCVKESFSWQNNPEALQDFVEPYKFGGECPKVSSGRAANANANAHA